MTKLTITARVSNRTEKSAGPNGRRKLVSFIEILAGGVVVGQRTTLGRYNSADALTEFKRFPERFTATGDLPLKAIAQVA